MAKKKIDEKAEAKINESYARAAEKATGVKPMSEDPKYKNFGKDTPKKKPVKKVQAKSTGKKTGKR